MENFGQPSPQMAALQAQLQNVINGYNQISNSPGMKAFPQTIQFVEGLDGATKFLKNMAPNSSAAVFDHNEAVFYMLSVDANGVPAKIKIGRFSLEDIPEPESNNVTKKDFEDFKSEVLSLLKQRNNYKNDNRNGGNN